MSAIGTLQLVNPLGMTLNVAVTDLDDAYATMRRFGAQGWTSGEIPAGGILLPYDLADSFDWSLIGAHAWKSPEGEAGVFYRGQFYKRREYAAKTTGKKMPAAIKYSRGAKPTDPPHLKEGDDDGVQYVTLAVFKGAGQVNPLFTTRAQGDQRREAPKAAPQAAAPPAREQNRGRSPEAVIDDLLSGIAPGQRRQIEALASARHVPAMRLAAIVARYAGDEPLGSAAVPRVLDALKGEAA